MLTVRIIRLSEEQEARDRAGSIIESLAERRQVDGSGPWIASYEGRDASRAFANCAEDLSEIDPHWFEVLDFTIVPGAGRGR